MGPPHHTSVLSRQGTRLWSSNDCERHSILLTKGGVISTFRYKTSNGQGHKNAKSSMNHPSSHKEEGDGSGSTDDTMLSEVGSHTKKKHVHYSQASIPALKLNSIKKKTKNLTDKNKDEFVCMNHRHCCHPVWFP